MQNLIGDTQTQTIRQKVHSWGIQMRAGLLLHSNVMSECNQAEEHIRRTTSTKDNSTHCFCIQYVPLVRLGSDNNSENVYLVIPCFVLFFLFVL